jgi:hypothetical protein
VYYHWSYLAPKYERFLFQHQSKVFRSDRDLIGVLTFGTAKKVPASLDFHHLSLVAELDRPNIENILALERLLGDEGQQHFQKEFGTSHQVAIHEVLWYSQSLFAAVKERQSTADFCRSGSVLRCKFIFKISRPVWQNLGRWGKVRAFG